MYMLRNIFIYQIRMFLYLQTKSAHRVNMDQLLRCIEVSKLIETGATSDRF